jgi:hypothetical protein
LKREKVWKVWCKLKRKTEWEAWRMTAAVGTVPNPAMPKCVHGKPRLIWGNPTGGPHVRGKQDVGRRLALAFRGIRDQFISANEKAQRSTFGSNVHYFYGQLGSDTRQLPVPSQCPCGFRSGSH